VTDKRTATALAIAGCYLHPLTALPDERGSILKVWRRDDGVINVEDIGEVYLSTVKPGVVKGWHLHHDMTLRYVCVSGRVLVGLYDNRSACPTRGTMLKVNLECRGSDYQMLVVPPGVWNGFRSVGEITSVVLNLPDLPHDPREIERMRPRDAGWPFDWGAYHYAG